MTREICVMEPKYTSPIVAKKSYLAFIPAVLVAAGIAVASLWEYPIVPNELMGSDKVLHGLMYALLSATLMGAFVFIRRARISMYVYVIIACTCYGALMEVLQRFCTFYRTGEMADIYADSLGAIIGALFIALLYYGRRKRSL